MTTPRLPGERRPARSRRRCYATSIPTRSCGVPGLGRLVGRTLAEAPSTLLLGAGYLPTLFDHHRRTAHDLAAGTTVVWDWGSREATIASPLGRWVAEDNTESRVRNAH